MTKDDIALADFVGQFYDDPLGFVMAAYEWDSDPQLQVCKLPSPWNMVYACEYGPDAWACDLLDRVGAKVRDNAFDGHSPVDAVREAIASGHGIGKSAMVAWLVDWIMSTRPNCHGTVTANTSDQLSSKTWAEIVKWTRKCITGHWFESTSGRGSMRMYQKEHPEDWFVHAQTCREENSEAFAGQHAVSSSSFYIFDEASAIPDVIWEVASGGLTDGEPFIFAFGNPTRNTGAFKDCFSSTRWNKQQIDSREVQITNKAELEAEITEHGLDSDRVKVRIRGIFPAQSCYQFISTADVDAASHVHLRKEQYEWAPKILTCDPAWTGDDALVIALRQGLYFKVLQTMQKNDNDMQVASIMARLEDEHQADAVFIDAGYGTGIVSGGRTLGRNWILVWFAEAAGDPGCLNKRAEMIRDARDWLKAGGAIDPADKQLYRDLTAPETVPRMDGKIQIESKQDMRRRGQASPNRLDALALSFAHPVAKKTKWQTTAGAVRGAKAGQNGAEYDPCKVAD
jgi:hypothetical protein